MKGAYSSRDARSKMFSKFHLERRNLQRVEADLHEGVSWDKLRLVSGLQLEDGAH